MSFVNFGPSDLGVQMLPPAPGTVNPQLALDAALVDGVMLQLPTRHPLGKGWLFDFTTGQFKRRGGSPMEARGEDNLAQWVEKCLITARNAHPIYSTKFGIQEPFELIGQVPNEALLAAYQQRITDALTQHDRIVAVEQFSFTQAPGDDALLVSFTVVLDQAVPRNPTNLVFTNVPISGASQ